MRAEDLYKAIGAIGDDLLEKSEQEAAGAEPGEIFAEAKTENGELPVEKRDESQLLTGKAAGAKQEKAKTEGVNAKDELSEKETPGTWKVNNNSSDNRRKGRSARVYITWAAAAAACLLVVLGGVRAIRNMRFGSAQPQQAVAEEAPAEDKKAAAAETAEEVDEAAPAEVAPAEMEEAPAPMAEEEAAPEESEPIAAGGSTADTEAKSAAQESAAADGVPQEEIPRAEKAEEEQTDGERPSSETNYDNGEGTWADEAFVKSDADAVLLVAAAENETSSADTEYLSPEAMDAVRIFQEKSSNIILGNTENTENKVFSPMDLYAAMGMLTEVTNGDARAELAALLGSGNLNIVREAAQKMITKAQREDDYGTGRLVNSLWLRRNTPYKITPLLRLGELYRTSVFSGQMGSGEYNALLKRWISENTEGLLDDMTDQAGFDGMTAMGLVSTLYYKAPWVEQFSEGFTKKETFHAPSGDLQADMMHTFLSCPYYSGKTFDAVALPLQDGNYAYFFLPKEGSAEKLAADPTWNYVMNEPKAWQDNVTVELSLPRFNVNQGMDLKEIFREMGVNAVFTDWSAFSDVLDGEYALTKAFQATRVAADEEGITGASCVFMEEAAGDESENKIVKIVFDRPFAFAVADRNGIMWFAGVVNEP